jgi:hypothetical protein
LSWICLRCRRRGKNFEQEGTGRTEKRWCRAGRRMVQPANVNGEYGTRNLDEEVELIYPEGR